MPNIKPRIRGFKTRSAATTKGLTTKAIATKALVATKRISKQVVRPEVKYMNTGSTNVTTTNFDNAGQCFYLSICGTGDTDEDRSGSEVHAKYIRFRMNVLKPIAGAQVQLTCRVILFIDKENRQSMPAVTNILETANATAQYTMENINRFRILKDELFTLDAQHTMKLVTYNAVLKHKIHYQTTAAAVTAADEGSVFLLVLSDSTAANGSPSAQFDSRISFTDS